MSIGAIEIKVGNIIKFEGGRYRVLKTMHVKPGKGGAFMQVEMKEINQGTKKNNRFRSDESVERLYVDVKKSQFLYQDGNNFEFMDIKSSEQFSVSIYLFDEGREKFLEDGTEVTVDCINDEPVAVNLPPRLKGVVKTTEPYLKGQTVTMAFKPATLENGVTITVPPFVKEGDEIFINTESMEYDSRA